jgi:hypothetical protein
MDFKHHSLVNWLKSPAAISAELSEALLRAAGKKRGFCRRGIVGGGDFSGHRSFSGGKKRGFCPGRVAGCS